MFKKSENAITEKTEIQEDIQININEDIDMGEFMAAIDNIVDAVVDNDFDYSLIDLLESYYILHFFTNVEIEMKDEELIIPDYVDCYKKMVAYDIKNGICDKSQVVYEYIAYFEKNIWRKLEYQKAIIPNRKLEDALAEFYEIMAALDEVAEMNKDVDVEQLMGQLGELSEQMKSIKMMSPLTESSDIES